MKLCCMMPLYALAETAWCEPLANYLMDRIERSLEQSPHVLATIVDRIVTESRFLCECRKLHLSSTLRRYLVDRLARATFREDRMAEKGRLPSVDCNDGCEYRRVIDLIHSFEEETPTYTDEGHYHDAPATLKEQVMEARYQLLTRHPEEGVEDSKEERCYYHNHLYTDKCPSRPVRAVSNEG